jgi:hypothetical protein
MSINRVALSINNTDQFDAPICTIAESQGFVAQQVTSPGSYDLTWTPKKTGRVMVYGRVTAQTPQANTGPPPLYPTLPPLYASCRGACTVADDASGTLESNLCNSASSCRLLVDVVDPNNQASCESKQLAGDINCDDVVDIADLRECIAQIVADPSDISCFEFWRRSFYENQ